jgi:YHS domain-containing protein
VRTTVSPDRDIDPLCGAVVDRAQAEGAGLTDRYNDVAYVFCGVSCLVAFEVNPQQALGLDDGWTPRRLWTPSRGDVGAPDGRPRSRRRGTDDGTVTGRVSARAGGGSSV